MVLEDFEYYKFTSNIWAKIVGKYNSYTMERVWHHGAAITSIG